MPEVEAAKFSCQACGRSFVWKEQLAGKKVKCKCGSTIAVPASATAPPVAPRIVPPPAPKRVKPAEPEVDDLYALAADADNAAAAMPAEVIDVPIAKPVRATPTKGKNNIPLAYRKGPTAREKATAAMLCIST